MLNPYPNGFFNYIVQPGDNFWLIAQRFNTTVHALVAANPGTDPYNPYAGQGIVVRSLIPFAGHEAVPMRMADSGDVSKAEFELSNTMWKLWGEHIAWTRLLIISIASNLPDEEFATRRLLRNPEDMAAAFKPIYGDKIAAKFGDLIKEHLVLASQLVKAAKAGDKSAAASIEKKWYANADELAAFLSSINPNWPRETLRTMLYEHLRLTKSEAVYRLAKDYAADIAAIDKIEEQSFTMADAFTKGIVKQFPDAFKH